MIEKVQNILSKIFKITEEELIKEFTWGGMNDKHTENMLKKFNIKYLIIEEESRGVRDILLYIDTLGGYIEKDTKLFIYKGKLYKEK